MNVVRSGTLARMTGMYGTYPDLLCRPPKIQMVFNHLKPGYDENESHTKEFFFGGGCLLMFHCVWFLIGFLNTNPLDPKHNPSDL